MKPFLFCLVMIIGSFQLRAQSTGELEAYNTYIKFLNECTHGLAIAKALLDNNNKELNRYIDIPQATTVAITNNDLPSNYFDKPDDNSEFYEISPIELSEICYTNSSSLSSSVASSLNNQTKQIVSILNQINQIRFDLETYVNGHDLNEKESIYGVYEYLEKAVKLFNNYADAHKKLANEINLKYKGDTDQLYAACADVHAVTKSILRNMRRENESNANNNVSKLASTITKLSQVAAANRSSYSVSNYDYLTKLIDEKATKIVTLVQDYISPGYVPVEEELYGKHYYYHNQLLNRYFNYTGPGFVRDMNKLLTGIGLSYILLDEEPLLFKVIYPVKIVEAQALNETKTIAEKPKEPVPNRLQFSEPTEKKPEPKPTPVKSPPVKNRDIIIVEIYDHFMMDRDSISLTYNGNPIVLNHMLQMESEKFYVEYDPSGPNVLSLKAENVGLMAPNTVTLTYRKEGERKKKKLINQMVAGEVIEIDLNQ